MTEICNRNIHRDTTRDRNGNREEQTQTARNTA